jgi:3-deoxy-manno-octulosonate cytidylyltransferase (CMP-KDO synthetase)
MEDAEKLEQLRALFIGGRIAVLQTGNPSAGVDTREDIERVEAIMRSLGRGSG